MSKQANLMFKVSLKLWCHVISTLIHLGFLEPSEYGFVVCVYIGLRYKANELVQARRLKVPSKSSASAKFSYLIPEQLRACFESAS